MSLLFQEKRFFSLLGIVSPKGLEALENQGLAVYMYIKIGTLSIKDARVRVLFGHQ